MSLQNACLSQNNNIDSLLNDYERIYRTELNRSDTILIKSYLEVLDHDCSMLDLYLDSKRYSGTFKAQLVKDLILDGKCLPQIVENIELEHYSSNSLRSYEIANYPLMELLKDSILLDDFVMKISKAQTLCKVKGSRHSSYLNRSYKRKFICLYKDLNIKELSDCEIEYIRICENSEGK